VVEGSADIGLVEGPTLHPALLRTPIGHDQIVLVVASGQPRIRVDGRGRFDLRAMTWVIREAGSGTRRALEDLARREGLSLDDLNVFLVLPSNEAVREAIEAGAGATVISRQVVASAIDAGRLVEIPIDLPQREYALLRHRDRHATPAHEALIAYLAVNSAAVARGR
jgi:DNA-binding transcriptional LysR family regulator